MDQIAAIMEAGDVSGVITLLVLGLLALLWRYGGKILDRLDKNTALTQKAHDVATEANKTAEHVASSIITNHGSKNLGDAIDRLTEWVMLLRTGQDLNAEQWKSVNTRLTALEQRPAPAAVVQVQGSSADVTSDC